MDWQELAPLAWHDGQLVKAAHLSQSDRRSELLASLLGLGETPHPVLVTASGVAEDGPLVRLKSETETDDGWKAECVIERPFQVLLPDRTIQTVTEAEGVWGESRERARVSWEWGRDDDVPSELYLCLEFLPTPDSWSPDTGSSMPTLPAFIQATLRDERRLLQSSRPLMPIARYEPAQRALDAEFVPPVLRVGLVKLFSESGLPTDLRRVHCELRDVVEVYASAISPGQTRAAESHAEVRMGDLLSLSTLLLCQQADLPGLENLSPHAVNCSIGHPIAGWFTRYQSHFPHVTDSSAAPFQDLLQKAERIIDRRPEFDLLGVERSLRNLTSFVRDLGSELRLMA